MRPMTFVILALGFSPGLMFMDFTGSSGPADMPVLAIAAQPALPVASAIPVASDTALAATLEPALPASGRIGEAYSGKVLATGGTPPYHVETSGSVPLGLVLSGLSLSGTFLAVYGESFSIAVTDSSVPSETFEIGPFEPEVILR